MNDNSGRNLGPPTLEGKPDPQPSEERSPAFPALPYDVDPETQVEEQPNHPSPEENSGDRRQSKKPRRRWKSNTKRQRVMVQHVPWRQRPAPTDEDGEWFIQGGKVSQSMGLFYDLIMVSVLATFSANNELRSAEVIVIFLSYYAVIMSVWKTQVHYDARYEGEDSYHRLTKAVQIGIFAFIGAAAGGWDLSKLLESSQLDVDVAPASELAAHQLAGRSFLTIGIVFVLSRVLLAAQFAWVVFAGKKAGRSTKNQKLSVWANLISAVLTAMAVGIPATNGAKVVAKIVLFYLGIAVVILVMWGQPLLFEQKVYPGHEIAERYGALSLIIIGEGFTGLIGALNKGIQNLHVTAASVYAQAFIVIIIIFNLYLFLFQHLGLNAGHLSPRRATCWEVSHFPLHFVMLLFLSGMINTIILQNYFNGINNTTPYWLDIADALRNNTTPDENVYRHSAIYLQRLDLQPEFDIMYEDLDALYNDPDPPSVPDIRFFMYTGSVIRAGEIYNNLTYMDDSMTTNTTDNEDRLTQAAAYTLQLQIVMADNAVQGVLWLFPTAGITLILSAIRSTIRYRFHGVAHYIINLGQVFFGIALSLLGLLDIGSNSIFSDLEFNVSTRMKPIYKLVDGDWALPIIMLCYTVVNVASMVTAWLGVRRARLR